jgi:hypothetical protein
MRKGPKVVEGGRSWCKVGVGLGFSVAVEAQGGGVWAWGDNKLGQLGLGLIGGSVFSGHVHTRRVAAVGGRRLRCFHPSPSTLPTPQHAAEYFLHFADGSSSWTHAISCSPALQRWLACNEQFVAAAAELAKLGCGVESSVLLKPDSVLSNSVSLAPLTPSPSKSALSPLKLCCVPFSLQVYGVQPFHQCIIVTLCLGTCMAPTVSLHGPAVSWLAGSYVTCQQPLQSMR